LRGGRRTDRPYEGVPVTRGQRPSQGCARRGRRADGLPRRRAAALASGRTGRGGSQGQGGGGGQAAPPDAGFGGDGAAGADAGRGWLYVKNERDARQAQLTRDVNDALSRVTALREKARTARTGSATLLAQAREQAQRAAALIENGPADEALAARVEQLQADLDEEE